MASQYVKLPLSGVGPGAGVSSLNALTGTLVLTAGTGITITQTGAQELTVANTSAVSFPLHAPTGVLADPPSYGFSGGDNDTGMYSTGDGNISFQANGFERLSINQNDSTFTGDLHVTGNIDAANYPPVGTANHLASYDGTGDLTSADKLRVDPLGGLISEPLFQPNNLSEYIQGNRVTLAIEPQQDSPNDSAVVLQLNTSLDPLDSGFNIGNASGGITVIDASHQAQGTGDLGTLDILRMNFGIGNGTDPITVRGFSYSYGFGNVAANVAINGPVQGYGFQPAFDAASAISSTAYINAFYDASNIQVPTPNYTSLNLSPNILSIINNNNYTGINMNPTIPTFTGNAGFTGIAVSPTLGTLGTNGFNGINVNPTITLNNTNATGLNVNMAGVTNYAGVQASLVVQDITYTFIQPGQNGNDVAISYLNTTTAGNEVATITPGNPTVVSVTIQSGVSTATQVLAALNANPTILANINCVITGTASNAQITYAQTNLSGGINPGTKKAAQFVGDVDIQGNLSFTGGLSLGAINSFANIDISGFSSGVNSIDTLITQPTTPANTTLNTDLLAINTAMLMNIGANSTLTSSFLGYTALGLPAVVNLGVGATVDRVGGAAFAISLDSSAGGGTIAEVDLCRALAIPNGVTTITKLKGYAMDLPFGDPGTTTWGFYESPGVNNYLAGNLLIGGTSGSDDVVTNASVALEVKSTTKAFVLSRMTTTERDALTAVNGMLLYNTTTDKFQGYESGVWVDIV